MTRFNSLILVSLLLGVAPAAQAQQTSDIEQVRAANRQFVAAIAARDINTMDTVWAHENYTSFIGPLSTAVVVGWDGVRQAWQMRFNEDVALNGHPTHRLPNTLNVSFVGRIGADILGQLRNVAASTGSACHSGQIELSPVLAAMRVPERIGMGAIRFSLGRHTTAEEIDAVVARLATIALS